MSERTFFKAPKRLANGETGDLRDHCEVFHMTAVDEKDMVFLSHLYRAIWMGGVVTVEDSKSKQTYRFGQ